MKINWIKALLAGAAGTLLVDLVGLLGTGRWWDIPRALSDAAGLPLPLAVLLHFVNGVALAAIYLALAPALYGPNWLRAVSYASLETVLAVWFMFFPLLGLGIAGLEGGWAVPFLSIARHWAFAIPLALLCRVSRGEAAFDGEHAEPAKAPIQQRIPRETIV